MESAVIRDPETGDWLLYGAPVAIVTANVVGEVRGQLDRIETEVEGRGLDAVGFIAYEAAPAFDPAMRVVPRSAETPLMVFSLFEPPSVLPVPWLEETVAHEIGAWTPTQTEIEYRHAVDQVHARIVEGETYQVNHTFRLRASFSGDPRSLFLSLVRSQPGSYAAFLDLGETAVCSASPELFFELAGDRLVSRPMKGTARRGWDPVSDYERRSGLLRSPKDRAENAMIVDMVRNDLGRVAEVGSVEVSGSFDIETHPTVFQMTTTVEARSEAPISEIFAALFPFASVTGAPKIRTMEIISELEKDARGVYTGAIGVIRPGRRARFSVGIRTAVVDRRAGRVEYGVGSGVVWDSVAAEEFRECMDKAEILSSPLPEFDLLETLLWEPEVGFALMGRHLDRITGAAEYFGREFDRSVVAEDLQRRAAEFGDRRHRVRLLLAADGSHRIEVMPISTDAAPTPVRLGLAADPTTVENPFLHFKTTHREVYETARRSRPDCEDVLLWNGRGEVTESTIANFVARFKGELVTPPVTCGLLAGTYRAELLDRGEIIERVITIDQLPEAEALYLINSVQGWRNVEWVN